MGDDASDRDVPIDPRTAREIVSAMRSAADSYRIIAQLEERIAAAREDLSKLRRVIFEGNGGHSMMVRLASVERDLADRSESASVDRRGRWDVRVALVGMLAALATSVVALLK